MTWLSMLAWLAFVALYAASVLVPRRRRTGRWSR